MNYAIRAIEYYLPERIIDNDFLHEESGIDRTFLETKIGINQRHIAGLQESTSDMAVNAAVRLFEQHDLTSKQVELLLLCTQNPDYRLPTTACLVQDRLHLKTSSLAFDVNLGCSGFVYALPIAGNFIATGRIHHAVLIMVDQYSRIIDYHDKNTAPLFGDAASAIWLAPCADEEGVIDAIFGTDGSHADKLILYNSGVVKNPDKPDTLYMDGRGIFKFSITVVPESVHEILERNHLTTCDIRYFVFHQANNYILSEIRKILSLSEEQMIIDLSFSGNTVSSTIPIALKHIFERNCLQKNDLMIFCGFGVGLSWGTLLYRY